MKQLNRRSIILLIPIILLGASLTLLIINRSQSYVYYERVDYVNSGSTGTANFYHPTGDIDFQNKHPLVIYVHGFSWQKDADLRIPIELTKRGFYVATVDIPGHGESGDFFSESDLLYVNEDDELEITQVCSDVLDKIEKLPAYDNIDKDQIGLVGHSYGGYTVLMNGLYDDRFSATISWAGVCDVRKAVPMKMIDEELIEIIKDNNPVQIMDNDTKQPENLFLLAHEDDDWHKTAEDLHEVTDCKMTLLDGPMLISPHSLLREDVMELTINWFEKVFFGSKTKNGPIVLTYEANYFLMVISLILMCISVLSIIIYCSKYILTKDGRSVIDDKEVNKNSLDKSDQKKFLLLSIGVFAGSWFIINLILSVLALFIVPFIIILFYVFYFKKTMNSEKVQRVSIKERLKTVPTQRALIYALFCAVVFLLCYFALALFYPFWLFYPHSLLAFAMTILFFPMLLSTEIVYRKMIYPNLEFVNNRKKQTYLVIILSFFLQIFMITQTYYTLIMPTLIAFTFAYLFVTILNGIIYHKTRRISATLLCSFIILGIFYGHAMSFLLNMIQMFL